MNFVWRALNLPMGGFWRSESQGAATCRACRATSRRRTACDVNGVCRPPATALRPALHGLGRPVQRGRPVGQLRDEVRAATTTAVLAAPAYVVGQAKALTLTSLTSSATVDTTVVKVTKQLWNAMKDSHTRVTLTITNTSAAAVTGPFYVELVGDPGGRRRSSTRRANGRRRASRTWSCRRRASRPERRSRWKSTCSRRSRSARPRR